MNSTSASVRDRLVHEVISPVLLLGAAEVDEASSLAELGYTSVQLTEMAVRIGEVFGIPFTPTKLFQYNGFAELTAHLTEAVGGPVRSEPEPAPPAGPAGPATSGPIAVIGMSFEFPGGAADPERFLRDLRTGTDSVTRIRESRPALVDDHLRDRGDLATFPEWAGFAEGVDSFDAAFFGIAPLEAQSMDPQQRKMLELTWRLLEDAGYRSSALKGRPVGVYVGTHGNDYGALVLSRPDLMETYGAYLDSGTHPALLANRVSRWFDFRGPSRVFNTACSSSLVALNAAVVDLRLGLCSEAVVGGVNALLSAHAFEYKVRGGMQAADGRCKTFDQRADGYVRGEGFATVLLKPLAAAERDGDRILGVIRGAAVNHDGATDSLRAPSAAAQADLVSAALADAGVPARTIGYVEAHGTGTALGDPIEVQGLTDAYRRADPDLPEASCGIGSVKTNIGHLEAAAGLAGLIKLLVCLQHRWLPGLLHFTGPSPFIDWAGSPFRVVAEAEPWRRKRDAGGRELPLRAGLSSFGFGGANAHVIVEEYRPAESRPASPAPDEPPGPALILLSARDPERLRALAARLADHLDEHPADPADVARTLRTAREPLPERLAFTARDRAELQRRLRRYAAGERSGDGLVTGNTRRTSGRSPGDGELRDRVAAGDHDVLLDRWVQGEPVDRELPAAHRAGLVPLPSYPFARDRHWFTDTFGGEPAAPVATRGLHPLLHENVSDFREQRFRTAWTGREFFLRDHVRDGRPSLPAVAWLEAVRAAVVLAHGDAAGGAGVRFTGVAWDRAYAHTAGGEPVHVSLQPAADGLVDFDCWSGDRVFCQGRAALVPSDEVRRTPVSPVPAAAGAMPSDAASLGSADSGGVETPSVAGVRLGDAYRALSFLDCGTGSWTATLCLPGPVRPTAAEFGLHPVLATAAVAMAAQRAGSAAEPAGADEVLMLGRCGPDVHAVVTADAVDLRDEDGHLLVRIAGIRFPAGDNEGAS